MVPEKRSLISSTLVLGGRIREAALPLTLVVVSRLGAGYDG